MASFNLGWFSNNWFFQHQNSSTTPAFAFLGAGRLFGRKDKTPKPPPPRRRKRFSPVIPRTPALDPKDGKYSRILRQYFWEVATRPDYRHTPEVDRILNEDSIFDHKPDATPEEIEENRKWWEEFKSSPVVQFLKRCDDINDSMRQQDIDKNKYPYHKEDRDLWKKLPLVPGLDGRPMPRKSIKNHKQASDRFWDWARQFFFGLWGYHQRPYPPGRPIDAAQVIGYKKLEDRYYDFIMRSGGFFYKDRLGRTRGPMELVGLKTAWAAGIIDTHTFVWTQDMDEWAPIGMVYGMEKAVATWEVRLGAAASAFIHKLQTGRPPWAPIKGLEKKTYQELQNEALESKRRDMAVLEANNGVWPGVKIPSHALFLWAGGPELTTLLEEDHMPNKCIPKELRVRLAKVLPGLRAWDVVSLEHVMDTLAYRGKWYRVPLGSYYTCPPYIDECHDVFFEMWELYKKLFARGWKACKSLIPNAHYITSLEDKGDVKWEKRLVKRRASMREAMKAGIQVDEYGVPLRPTRRRN